MRVFIGVFINVCIIIIIICNAIYIYADFDSKHQSKQFSANENLPPLHIETINTDTVKIILRQQDSAIVISGGHLIKRIPYHQTSTVINACSLPLRQPKKDPDEDQYRHGPYAIHYDSRFGDGYYIGALEEITVPNMPDGRFDMDKPMKWQTVMTVLCYNSSAKGYYFLPENMNDPYSSPVYSMDTCALKTAYNKYLKQLK